MNKLLESLATNTGLAINKEKSKVFFSKGTKNKQEFRTTIGEAEGKLPIKYLGIPLSANYLKARNYTSLIDKCRNRIERWNTSSLSLSHSLSLSLSGAYKNCII